MYSWWEGEAWLDLQCWLVRIYCSCQRKVTTRLQIGRRGLTGGSPVAFSLFACFSFSLQDVGFPESQPEPAHTVDKERKSGTNMLYGEKVLCSPNSSSFECVSYRGK